MLYDKISIREVLVTTDVNLLQTMYEEGLSTHNAFLAITAQNELVRRGQQEYIGDTLGQLIAEAREQLADNPTFLRALAHSLMMLKSISRSLYKIGKSLNPDSPANIAQP